MRNKIELLGNGVTPSDVKNCIVEEKYIKIGKKILVCHLTLDNGFECIGNAGVVDPENFDFETGKPIAYKNALDDVWFHLSSILQNQVCK
jgi:hypothetical protein